MEMPYSRCTKKNIMLKKLYKVNIHPFQIVREVNMNYLIEFS